MRWRGLTTFPTQARHLTVGDLISHDHGVWQYTGTQDRGGGEVYATFDHVAGHCPPHLINRRGRKGMRLLITDTSGKWTSYAYVDRYPTHRWPQCSCCGEPVPCRESLVDAAVEKANDRAAAIDRKLPGMCWSCDEPITRRQRSVVYPGPNLDHPLKPSPLFHTRRGCLADAVTYENRWLTADPTRPRILTWPVCPDTLITHHDDTVTCDTCDTTTHQHQSASTCYCHTRDCPLLCADVAERDGGWGCRYTTPTRNITEAIEQAFIRDRTPR